jgi:molybdenum cofactor cytidylyltransferase
MPPPVEGVRLPTVIVLASGRGERFRASGGQVHKLQALLSGMTVLARTLQAVRASGLPWHVEDLGHPGMGDSIAAAVRATQDAAGWLVLPADLPLIRPGTLCQIAQAVQVARPGGVVVPVHAGQRGHPVGFSAACGPALMALRGSQGAAPVVRAQGAIELPVDDIGTVTDIDTLDDLARATRLLAGD